MKALTIWQPYASLIAWGIKRHETRHWKPYASVLKAGDTIAIHAASRSLGTAERQLLAHALIHPHIQAQGGVAKLPYGAIVAVARVVAFHPIAPVFCTRLSPTELLCGNYATGRYAWELEIIDTLAQPVTIPGKQGIWNWNDHAPR